ncbi:MAG: hypothetical protein IJF33_06765, partial [Clostridia bacterium]|nr:hypothetical protein [Clostridia bacterium]
MCFQERPVRPSFREAFRRAALQVGLYESATNSEREHFRELCYIIAEIYVHDPDSRIKIADEYLEAHLVQEIFGELTMDHLRLVYRNLKAQTRLIKNKHAYLRASLYHSVFELEAHYANLVNHDLA